MDIVYAMPRQEHRLFINVIHACPNACMFCVDFMGDTFFGFDLKAGRVPSKAQIVAAIESFPRRMDVKEIYFCGIGEPLLRYDVVVETAEYCKSIVGDDGVVAINTSGTFYINNQRVDFASKFDLIQVSLNAENEEKYNQICRPKVAGAYCAMIAFLNHLRGFIDSSGASCRVELSVVDSSEICNLPERERTGGVPPVPDFEACQRIADSFGWPLKIKRLMSGFEYPEWEAFASSIRNAQEPHTA